jgi:hypothetical protein
MVELPMWAVGVILHIMLSGTLPFEVSTIDEARKAHEKPNNVLDGDTNEFWQEVPEVAHK